jgi:hypothetical protein
MSNSQRGRTHVWLRNNIVGLVALFVALSGTTYAAQTASNAGSSGAHKAKKKKVARGPAGPQGPAGPAGSPATNALTLGGLPASDYQHRCDAGAIWGFANINTTGLPMNGSFTGAGVAAFNCRGGSVLIKRNNFAGTYTVKFSNSVTGFAVGTIEDPGANDGRDISVEPNGTPGEFTVETQDEIGNFVNDTKFTIVAV